MAVRLLGLSALLVGGPACSGAASTDFGIDAAASRDATTLVDTSSGEMDAASPAIEAATDDDGAAATDARATPEAGVAPDSGVGEAGGDDAGPSLCSRICNGCCDAQGKCRAGTTVALCGGNGGTCEDCSKKQCPLTETGCCGAGGCGCAIGGLVGCN